jgi:hypothetical protein
MAEPLTSIILHVMLHVIQPWVSEDGEHLCSENVDIEITAWEVSSSNKFSKLVLRLICNIIH